MAKKPNSRRNLDEAIKRVHGIGDYIPVRDSKANAIVAQMLSGGVVKGGSALKLRFGNRFTRYTTDLDAARAESLADVEQHFISVIFRCLRQIK